MEFVIKIAAQAGAGIMVTGRTISKCFTRGGYNVVGYPEYPSLVRGGHNVYQIIVSDEKVNSPRKKTNLLIALNKDAIFYHKDFLADNASIIYDDSIDISKFEIKEGIKTIPLPINKIIQENGGTLKMKNTVAVGAALAAINYPLEILESVLRDEFGRKGEEVVNKNLAVAKGGYEFVKNHPTNLGVELKPLSEKRKILVGGNEAIALGAVSGGLKFYSAYPMTPASTILHYLAAHERDFGIVVKQTEDEIAAIHYAIGASFTGVRSMVATSGGGFALMTEALGLAALSETPLVVGLVQRVGPSTGMPTWTEQGDLKFALNASQGEFPRIIIAPGDVDEAYSLSAEAFNWAEKYQLPVIIISDKFLSESIFSTERENFDPSKIKIDRGKIVENPPELPPNTRFNRYKITEDGVSPRTLPGTPNGMHVGTSYEHDESGFSTELFSMRNAQVDKRARKVEYILKELPPPAVYGSEDPDVVLVCWGSMKLPGIDAIKMLEKEGIKARLIHFNYVFPLDKQKVKALFDTDKPIVMFENNSTGQFKGILKEYCDVDPDFLLLKYDGRPIYAEELVREIKKLKQNGFKKSGDETEMIKIKEDEDLEYYAPFKYGL